MSIQRYCCCFEHDGCGGAWATMDEDKNGSYVLYVDYLKLEEKYNKIKNVIDHLERGE